VNPETAIEPARTSPPMAPVPVAADPTDRRVRDVLPAVVRQLPVGVGIMRRDRTLAYHNDELARVLRLDEDVSGPPLPPVRRPDGTVFAGGRDPLDRVFTDGGTLSDRPLIVGRADGSWVATTVKATPIVDPEGVIVGAVLYVEDQTADADDLSLRDAFVGVLSHELRTPITAIYGGTQLLLSDRITDDVRATLVRDVAAEAERLHRLVEDLLAITRLERGLSDARGEPVLLQRLAEQAARAEERGQPGQRIVVDATPGLPAVRADEGFALQIMRNLVAEAVRVSPPTEPVHVTIREVDDTVEVAVLDRGPGFPVDTGPDAFRLFYRSPAVAARASSTGISLFVARALVEAQGGRIWLRNRLGGGAEVGFSLPVLALAPDE